MAAPHHLAPVGSAVCRSIAVPRASIRRTIAQRSAVFQAGPRLSLRSGSSGQASEEAAFCDTNLRSLAADQGRNSCNHHCQRVAVLSLSMDDLCFASHLDNCEAGLRQFLLKVLSGRRVGTADGVLFCFVSVLADWKRPVPIHHCANGRQVILFVGTLLWWDNLEVEGTPPVLGVKVG
jgi:hypothetical protein